MSNNTSSIPSKDDKNNNNILDLQPTPKKKYVIMAKPTYAMSAVFFGTFAYYTSRRMPLMAKVSLISSGLFLTSGLLIDNSYTNTGAFLAGGLSAALSASTWASALKHGKMFPLVLGTLTVSSMAYHGFFSLYNSLDEVEEMIKRHDNHVRMIKQEEELKKQQS
ncbi:hypothetical protein SAMD00019534_109520, partial [Acytostelium subglobosum LB1]|uniref:hypothetical protein n=1 Tax=Acytostelium subglobosum LB1 TaxID=1410327 RepID=UPI0006448E99